MYSATCADYNFMQDSTNRHDSNGTMAYIVGVPDYAGIKSRSTGRGSRAKAVSLCNAIAWFLHFIQLHFLLTC